MEVSAFLGRFPPFSALDASELDALVPHVQIEYFPAGTVILEQAGAPAEHLYVVRAGVVEVVSDGQVLDLLGEGEPFGHISLVSGMGPVATIRAHRDTLCYLVDQEVARSVLGTPSGLAHFGSVVRQRLEATAGEAGAGSMDPYRTPVGRLVRREPVVCRGDTTVREAAEVMTAERVSSLLVPFEDGWGIVTDRDLRTRVLAAERSPDTPVAEVMTAPVVTVPDDTVAAEVLLRMLEHGIHHFPVVARGGRLLGMVTDTDLMGFERQSPFALRTAIERAGTPDAVGEAGRRLPDVVRELVEGGGDPVDSGHVVSLVVDAMTRRLVDLAVADLGEPPVAWAWLALGSQARREQALRTDQDHAIAFADGPADHDDYFGELGRRVTDGLEKAGIPRCDGDVMASNPALRRPLEHWVEQFRTWMRDPGLAGSQQSSILFDFRRVHGSLDAEGPLDEVVATAPSHPVFLKHLGRRALDDRPPTGFFRDFVVEDRGEHAGRLDVKRRGISLVTELARASAIGIGSPEKRTLGRLRAAHGAGVIDEETRLGLEESFRLLWRIRLEHHARQVASREPLDDFVDPARLGPIARQELKAAFRVISGAQRGLALELGVPLR